MKEDRMETHEAAVTAFGESSLVESSRVSNREAPS